MFEKDIKFITDFSLNKIKRLGSYFTFDKIFNSDIHPAILKYLSSELDFLIYEDRKKLLQDSVFDYSGQKIAQYFNLINKEIKKTKRVSFEDIKHLVIQAVSFNVHFIVRPKWSLTRLFYNNTDSRSIEDLKILFEYLYYYDYIKNIYIGYLENRNILSLNASEFEKIYTKIDEELFDNQSEKFLDNALYTMADFFNIGSVRKTRVPANAVLNFLNEKDLSKKATNLENYYSENLKQKFEIEDIKAAMETDIIDKETKSNVEDEEQSDITSEIADEEMVENVEETEPENPIEEKDILDEEIIDNETVEAESEIPEEISEDEIEEFEEEKNLDVPKEIETEIEDNKNENESDVEKKPEDNLEKDKIEEDVQDSTKEKIEEKNSEPDFEIEDKKPVESKKPLPKQKTDILDNLDLDELISKELEDINIAPGKKENSDKIVEEDSESDDDFEKKLNAEIENIGKFDESDVSDEQDEFEDINDKVDDVENEEEVTEIKDEKSENELEEEKKETEISESEETPEASEETEIEESDNLDDILAKFDSELKSLEKNAKALREELEEQDEDFDDYFSSKENDNYSIERLEEESSKFKEEESETKPETKSEFESEPEINDEDIVDELETSDDFEIEEKPKVIPEEKAKNEKIKRDEEDNIKEDFEFDESEEEQEEFEDEKYDKIKETSAAENSDREKDIFSFLTDKEIDKIVTNIFNEDREDFANTMEKIMECSNYKEATDILKGVFLTYRINPYSKDAITVTKAVSSYFDQGMED